ncbi:hypothetical protein B7R54_12925 [Subtercola boreus]|uniref:Uncharacterized protein n=1 Tax=Subtercola boreus TaxID=120213 RepID=A0A3E0VJ84_9MICO|nr:hypothetical protein [Subtercola boreus]RFA10006.1 hypothetical protein B7R54_12925 [Subtercola boreus]TQL52848.1 hypothetical protein FB464_0334 [Subtercola boreus]
MVNRSARLALCVSAAAVLMFGVAACSAPDVSPTVIPNPSLTAGPSASTNAEWGAYGTKDDACAAVAGDVLTLALAPKNLALADPDGGVDDIDDTIRTAAASAPPAIAANYAQLSAIVRTYGQALSSWNDEVEAIRASASATASASASSSASTATANPTPGAPATSTPTPEPERPAFVDTAFEAQLDSIKNWLSDTCG